MESDSDVEVTYMDESDYDEELCPACKSGEGLESKWLGSNRCPKLVAYSVLTGRSFTEKLRVN